MQEKINVQKRKISSFFGYGYMHISKALTEIIIFQNKKNIAYVIMYICPANKCTEYLLVAGTVTIQQYHAWAFTRETNNTRQFFQTPNKTLLQLITLRFSPPQLERINFILDHKFFHFFVSAVFPTWLGWSKEPRGVHLFVNHSGCGVLDLESLPLEAVANEHYTIHQTLLGEPLHVQASDLLHKLLLWRHAVLATLDRHSARVVSLSAASGSLRSKWHWALLLWSTILSFLDFNGHKSKA